MIEEIDIEVGRWILGVEFSDWMPYEEKYWENAPCKNGVVETIDPETGSVMFLTYPRNRCSIQASLERRDPSKHYGNLSGDEKKLIKHRGKLEFRYAITERALDLKKLLIHLHVEANGNEHNWQVPTKCLRGRVGGCSICKK